MPKSKAKFTNIGSGVKNSTPITREQLSDPLLSRRELIIGGVLVFLSFAPLYFGWRVFWFLTDDAYISFRYISNSMLGYGYVWNPPPFRPVEGYTNFLWIVVLEIVWRVLGIEPPKSANYLTLLFSFLTLAVVSLMLLKLNWNNLLRRYRLFFLVLLLVAILTNRTFLAWTSSGLETAMFNFFLIAWLYSTVFIDECSVEWVFCLSAFSTLMALTRPDGLLFAGASVLLFISAFRKRTCTHIRHIFAFSPLLLIVIHVAWRISFYGEWLPNTYYAKNTGVWPESGVRYLLSFIIEYSLWVWLGLAAFVCFTRFTEVKSAMYGVSNTGGQVMKGHRTAAKRKVTSLKVTVVLVVILLHVAYYTFIIGGDHFEYRVYSHLIPLIFFSCIWLLNVVRLTPLISSVILIVFILLSYPIPWTHWKISQGLTTRKQTFVMKIPLSQHWPTPFRGYVELFDDLQFWLIEHFVCMRHQEHKIFCERQIQKLPSRAEGALLSHKDYPVMVDKAVGVPGWVLPQIHIIDYWGLNDYVISRNPVDVHKIRYIAHSRKPPDGYVECFSPNVRVLKGKKVEITKREKELTAEDIRECERVWWYGSRNRIKK